MLKISYTIRCGYIIVMLLLVTSCGGSSGSDIDYVAIGASDATGIGASPPTRGYVFQIEDGLDQNCGDTGLVNLGVPGLQTDEIENVEVPAATALDANIITVWAGANDLIAGRSLESFRSDLADILSTLSSETNAAIFIANLPVLTQIPRFQKDPDPDVTSERVAAYNSIIASEASASGAILVDLSTMPTSSALVSDDGFHPSNEGHELIASLFLSQIIPVVCPQ